MTFMNKDIYSAITFFCGHFNFLDISTCIVIMNCKSKVCEYIKTIIWFQITNSITKFKRFAVHVIFSKNGSSDVLIK